MSKLQEKIILHSEYTRQYPDPLNRNSTMDALNIGHHILLSKAIKVPTGIPKDPNPREQKIDYGIYREVYESLINTDDSSFHLKNKGITIYAKKVDYSPDKRVATVYLGTDDGIADGGHTYELILKAIGNEECPEEQFIKFEIITGIPRDMRVDITGGLNTAVQVQPASLANLEHKFDWIKDTLADAPYANNIAYKQNENAQYDIRTILSLLTLFNVNKFSQTSHPKDSYISKANCLDLYLADSDSFKMLKPVLKDILHLHDYVHIKSRERYNAVKSGKAAAMKGVFTEKRKRGAYSFIFLGTESKVKLYDGSMYPMLGALRYLVEQKPDEDVYSWKLENFKEVLTFFDEIAPELVSITYETSKTYGLKPNPIGKDDNHWGNLYKTVNVHYLENYAK